ncbi:MAG: flagellar hook-basal body protein [Fervidobacterium sp.]|nr:flagellar hook-basal body protein [Fervidobacterium sp.]
MYRGVYTAAMGMLVDITKIDTISNNLSNVETNGYKADALAFKTYLEKEIYRIRPKPEDKKVEAKRIGRLEQAVILDEVRTRLEQGILEQTNVPTHLAIHGEGFFAIRKGNEVYYTRNGEFIRDVNGYLVNTQGYYVLNSNGQQLQLPENFSIDDFGNVLGENGEIIDRIGIYSLQNPRKQGETLFSGNAQLIRDDQLTQSNTRILSGYLEKSNVNVVREMVKMIDAHRHYEATSKAILVHDELLNKVINNVGTLR